MTTKKTQIASGLAALAIVATAAWTRADDGHGGLAAAFTTSQAAFSAERAERDRRRLKTPEELQREAKDRDALAKLPPPTEKELCEGIFGESKLVTSPKTGNKYCIKLREEGGRANEGGGHLKAQWEIDREVALLDYWAAQPPPPAKTPKEECEGPFKENVYVQSTKGNFYCLKARDEGGRANEGGGQVKSPWELKREADLEDYWKDHPAPELPPKQACEAFGDHVYVISPEGNAYCLSKYTQD